jgi:hypothetical protein
MPQDTQSTADTVLTLGAHRKLTDPVVKAARPPAKGNQIIFDPRLAGLGFRITSGGSRSFILNYRFKGRQRRITIGQYPAWTLSSSS